MVNKDIYDKLHIIQNLLLQCSEFFKHEQLHNACMELGKALYVVIDLIYEIEQQAENDHNSNDRDKEA